ncbi:MAG: hypothetical protein KKH01_01185 [Firmicutes bacterium]|nr:hypothetical protein [Bacillota bacterium]
MDSYSTQTLKIYKEQLKRRKKKVVGFWSFMMAVFGIIAAISFLFYSNATLFKVLFYIFIGIFGFFFILVLMLLIFFVSEKPLYEILYPKVINDHNYEESVFITYNAYPKDLDFFTFGGLYPLRSSKFLRFQLSFENTHGFHVDVYDAYIATSNGKTTITHLNGYYLIFRDYGTTQFQLRTQGNPFVDPKYKKLTDINDVRAFVPASEFDIDPQLINLYHRIKNEYQSPSVTIGCNGTDLHIGITLSPMRRNVKVLTEDIYQELRRSLMQMVDLANSIK